MQLGFTEYESSDELYDALTSKLTDGIKGGEFTTILQSNAYQAVAPELYNAKAGQVSNSGVTIQAPPGSSSQKSSTQHKFGAGAAVATVFLILFCIAVAGYYYQYHYLPDQAEAAEKAQKEAELNRRYSDAGGEDFDYERPSSNPIGVQKVMD
jgi:hypothetical protein